MKGSRKRFIETAFALRILAFDEAAAIAYGEIIGLARQMGRPLSVPDGQIAAIARAGRYALATRNIKGFTQCGVPLLDPFEP